MSTSPRLSLPFLAAGQAQKEFAHNEALLTLDCLVAPALDGLGQNAPPASPSPGACYVVGPSPTGSFAGKANQIAYYSSGGWRFLAPPEGVQMAMKANGTIATFRGGAWESGVTRADAVLIGGTRVVSTQSAAIASPSGGTTIDSPARSTIDAILSALRHHGLIA